MAAAVPSCRVSLSPSKGRAGVGGSQPRARAVRTVVPQTTGLITPRGVSGVARSLPMIRLIVLHSGTIMYWHANVQCTLHCTLVHRNGSPLYCTISVPEWLSITLFISVPEWLSIILYISVPEWLSITHYISVPDGSPL